MDNYIYSKIALGLLASGVIGFFIGGWWAWSVFGAWRRRTTGAHEAAVQGYEDQIAESGRRLDDEKARWAEAYAAAEASEARVRALEARLRSMEGGGSRDESQAAEANPDWQERLDTALAQNATVIQVLEDQVAESARSLENEKARYAEASAAAEANLIRIRELEAQLQSLEESRQTKDVDTSAAPPEDGLRERLDAALAEKESALQALEARFAAEAAAHEESKTRFDGIVMEKDRTISELLAKIDSLSGAETKLEEARARQVALEEQVADYRQTIDTWEEHVNTLTRDQAAKLEAAQAENTRLLQDLEALQANLSERNEAISRLEADAALLSHVRQSMRERQTRIDGLKLQLDHANEALHKTEAQLAEVKRFADASRDQQALERDAAITRLQGELDAVRANLSDRNEDISRLEADAALLSHMRQSMRERQTRIDGLKLQLDQAREALAHAHAGLSQESEISHLKEDIAALRTRLSERNEAISRLEADAALLSHVRQSMRERQTRIDGLKLQLDHMRDALQKSEAELAEVKRFAESSRDQQARERDAEIASLKADLESVRSNLSERNNDISRLEADAALLSHVRQSMRERQTRIDGLTLQLSNAKKELAEAHAAKAVDPGQIEEWAQALAEKDRQIQLLESNVLASGHDLQPEVDRLRTEIQDRDEQIAAWESRYEASVSELQERIRELESKPVAATAIGAPPEEVQAKLRLATMRGIQFRPDSDEIDPASLAILDDAIEALRQLDGGSTVEIAGHTDAWGDDMANLHLSERRAHAVKDFLVTRGVDGSKLMTRGYGGSRPIADNLSADGRYANRRIEFVVRG